MLFPTHRDAGKKITATSSGTVHHCRCRIFESFLLSTSTAPTRRCQDHRASAWPVGKTALTSGLFPMSVNNLDRCRKKSSPWPSVFIRICLLIVPGDAGQAVEPLPARNPRITRSCMMPGEMRITAACWPGWNPAWVSHLPCRRMPEINLHLHRDGALSALQILLGAYSLSTSDRAHSNAISTTVPLLGRLVWVPLRASGS